MDTIESCLSKINSYLNSDSFSQPLFVNVNTLEDLQRLKEELPAGLHQVSIADFCQDSDEVPSTDKLLDTLAKDSRKVLLTDVISALELQGDGELQKVLSSLSTLFVQNKLIVICYQGLRYFNDFKDPRFARRFIQIGGRTQAKPNLIFISPDLINASMQPQVRSIQSLIKRIESVKDNQLYVITRKRKSDFQGALLFISELTNAYDILVAMDNNIVAILEKKLGTPSQWKELLQRFSGRCKSWQEIIQSEFGAGSNLAYLFQNWTSWDEFKRWLYFILLKINAKKENGYLYYAASKAECVEDFPRELFRSILDFTPRAENFKSLYAERKILLNTLKNNDVEVVDFCLFVKYKEQDAIYYLTNNNQPEREAIIACLAQYNYPANELSGIMSLVYPELAAYLKKYRLGIPVLDEYFDNYKLLKLTNRITPEFENIVNQQAIERNYNHLVPSRSSIIDRLAGASACAFWIDAMGLEYLGYIMEQCQSLGLLANVSVCRANIPTITSLNKDFIDDFQNKGIEISTIKELDEIKHHGKDQFDYEKTKLPLHLTRELEIIADVLRTAFQKLKSGSFEKAIIVSDHGASRLAVIKENTMDFDVDSKGTHGGRCCAYSESLPQIQTATVEDGYYVLAGYDRFKGGRKASVETHGGATLEEVLVPVIELTLRNSNLEVCFVKNTITVSFRKKASISIFSKTKLQAVSLCINDQFYIGKEDGSYWTFEMPDIKRPGEYHADIYTNNNLIASQLPFFVEKESAKENDLL